MFLPKCCTYTVPVNIAHLLNKSFSFAMQTFKSLYASLKLQVFFCWFLLLWGLANCSTLKNLKWGGELFRAFVATLKSLHTSLKLQVFLRVCGLTNCCIWEIALNLFVTCQSNLMLWMFCNRYCRERNTLNYKWRKSICIKTLNQFFT